MKTNYLISILSILFIMSCGENKKTDIDPNNIKPESETPLSQAQNIKAVSHFVVKEDMSPADNSEIIDEPYDKLQESVQAKLMKDGKSINIINEDGSIYKIEAQSVSIPSNKPGFITSRNIAFAKAELRAKMSILQMKSEAITSGRSFSSFENYGTGGEDPNSISKASYLDKVKAIADKSLDKALTELGVNDSELSKYNQSQKEKMFEDSYNNLVSSYVAEMIKGVSVIKIVEGEIGRNDYQIAVCVKYSPEQQAQASNQEYLGASKEVFNSKIVEKLISSKSEKLISKLGAQVFCDENGNRFLLGFGQASVRKVEKNQSRYVQSGYKKARLDAINNMKNFLAEDIVSKEIREISESDISYMDGSYDYFSEDKMTTLINSKKSTVDMTSSTIKNWKGIHPVSNNLVVGSIVILSKSNNLNFNSSNSKTKNNNSTTTNKSKYLESESLDGEDF